MHAYFKLELKLACKYNHNHTEFVQTEFVHATADTRQHRPERRDAPA